MDTNKEIRVRFAPSPTGYLHIGGLRTALFNYLFARHNKGKFILRIEDTDQTRKVEGAVENLIKTLKIMGLDYDEGPEVGGDFGPYYQSQRLDIYKKYCGQLIKQGDAYYAFETPEEIEEMRKSQLAQGADNVMYDRSARNLTKAEVEEKLNSGIPHVIRLKVPLDTEIEFNDLIRGTVKMNTNLIDDQVLIKSDGYPTYHLANVIDDHLMGITHVIRGEEWLTSVPKHILLYKAFGWEVPKLAHVPLILNPDKSKLSKRQGDVATEDFLKEYLPEAIINFVALLGWNPGKGETREIFTLKELIESFTLDKVNSSSAIFDIEKLKWMNKEYQNLLREKKPEFLDSKLKDFYVPHFGENVLTDSTMGITLTVTPASNYSEAASKASVEFPKGVSLTNEQLAIVQQDASQDILKNLIKMINEVDVNNGFNELLKLCKDIIENLQKETGFKGKIFFQPIRLVLKGSEHGRELGLYLASLLEYLGKEKVIKMIEKYLLNKK